MRGANGACLQGGPGSPRASAPCSPSSCWCRGGSCGGRAAKRPNGTTTRLKGSGAAGSLPRSVRTGSLPKVCLHRKVHSAPNKLNTLQQPEPKDRPQISEPTFMESTATRACVPLMPTPSRPPPQVHQSVTSRLATVDLLEFYLFYFF